MLQRKDSNRLCYQFGSLLEVLDWVKQTRPTWKQASSRSTSGGRSWDLGVGYDGALRLARDGWEEGVRKLDALASAVPNGIAYEQRYGVAGERPDVPRYLAGDPFNMIHRGKARKPKPTMTIAVNVSAVASTTADAMWNFGAALVALVDRLESRHVRVELLGLWGTNCSGQGRFCFSWLIKRAEDALDLSAVAFSLAHPAMLRRVGFAVIERSAYKDDWGYGAPNSQNSPADYVDIAEGALCIGGVGMNSQACRTMPGALAFATDAINNAAAALGMEPIAELEEVA